MRKISWIGAAAAGLFAVATAVIGDIKQEQAINEAVEKRLNSQNDSEEDDDEEEES